MNWYLTEAASGGPLLVPSVSEAKCRRNALFAALPFLLMTLTATSAHAQDRASDSGGRTIDQAMAHPQFGTSYACTEHPAGALPLLGGDLGRDCVVQKFDEIGDRAFMRSYDGDGLDNKDRHGWIAEVLSPCDCVVLRVHENPVLSVPGRTGKPPASFVLMRSADGVYFLLAHVQAVRVAPGLVVKRGQALAQFGNNGLGRMPHVHVGAWRGTDALRMRWDQKAIPVE